MAKKTNKEDLAFSIALDALLDGKKIARKEQKDNGIYLVLTEEGKTENYITLRNKNLKAFFTYFPTVEDILAEDWIVIAE